MICSADAPGNVRSLPSCHPWSEQRGFNPFTIGAGQNTTPALLYRLQFFPSAPAVHLDIRTMVAANSAKSEHATATESTDFSLLIPYNPFHPFAMPPTDELLSHAVLLTEDFAPSRQDDAFDARSAGSHGDFCTAVNSFNATRREMAASRFFSGLRYS